MYNKGSTEENVGIWKNEWSGAAGIRTFTTAWNSSGKSIGLTSCITTDSEKFKLTAQFRNKTYERLTVLVLEHFVRDIGAQYCIVWHIPLQKRRIVLIIQSDEYNLSLEWKADTYCPV